MTDDEVVRAEQRFHELMRDKMAKSPNKYDWLDAAYMVALDQQFSSVVGGSRWQEFVERVRPQEKS